LNNTQIKPEDINHNKLNDDEEIAPEIDVKPNNLLNNIKFMFDQNTDRCKKRSEQMKKMRQKIVVPKDENEVVNEVKETKDHSVSNTSKDAGISHTDTKVKIKHDKLQLDEDDKDHDHYSRNRAKSIPKKVFVEKSEKENKAFILETAINSKNISDNNLTSHLVDFIEEPEVIVSDIDVDIEADDTEITENKIITKNSSKSSFIPITNTLKDKTNLINNENNFTDSYKFALGLNATEDSPKNAIEESENKAVIDNNGFQGTFDSKHNIQNYVLNSIVEEDNSDYTDSEVGNIRRKPLVTPSGFSPNKEDKENRLTGKFELLNLSPKSVTSSIISSKDPSPKNANIIPVNNNVFFTFKKSNISQPDVGKIIREKINNICHKISKSDIVDARIGIIKIIENLEKKYSNKSKNVNKNVNCNVIKKKKVLRLFLNAKCKICV